MSSVVVITVILLAPVLWQVPRTFWPLRLDPAGSHFTGLYRRYSVATFTGYVSDVKGWVEKKTVGSVTAQTTGFVTGNTVAATTTVNDGRRTFSTTHDAFFLTDDAGNTRSVDAANVSPAVGDGQLVSAAWLVHNGKTGNAFVVYNHTTNQVYVEATRRGMRSARRGLVKMILPLPTLYQALLFVLIVTIPLIVVLGLGAEWQARHFRKRGVRPLVEMLAQRASGMPPRRVEAPVQVPAPADGDARIDLATQVKEITSLHDSGALTDDEFRAAKTKLLGR